MCGGLREMGSGVWGMTGRWVGVWGMTGDGVWE